MKTELDKTVSVVCTALKAIHGDPTQYVVVDIGSVTTQIIGFRVTTLDGMVPQYFGKKKSDGLFIELMSTDKIYQTNEVPNA